ncbi:alpha/beta hydrolase [Enterobacteriaceae bacterium 4M9]|nr:alpha/beta hydrolase [Enterobacteriaceae bacterium 4M9]
MKRHLRRLLSSVLLFITTIGLCQAQPVLKPLGPNIADTGSAWYHFRSATFDSADKQRHYKVWVAIPNGAAPQAGRPALVMLDGNAAMSKLSEALLGRIAKAKAPVLVAVGYQTALPFDVSSRTRDYTPVAPVSGHAIYKEDQGGGSAVFRHLLLESILPWAESQARINRNELSLWGHSYGGLFVLDTFYSAPERFRNYYAASASLGWGKDVMLTRARALSHTALAGKQLQLDEGDDQSTMPAQDYNAQLVEILKQKGIDVNYRVYPGLGHGPMFDASLLETINAVAGVAGVG